MSAVGSGGTVTMSVKVLGVTEMVAQMRQITTTLGDVSTKVNELTATMGKGLGTALPQGFEQIGTSAEQASVKTQTFTERMSGFQGNLLTAATSVGTFTASIFGIDAAMDNLTKSELALEQARVRQDRMQTTLQAQELRLNELRTSGTATAEEIAVAEERVNTTRQQLEVQTERVSFMQQNLNEDYSQFAAQILPQVITASLSGVTAMTSMVQLIGKSDTAVKLLNSGWDKFKVMLTSIIPPMTQTHGAITTTISSLGMLGTALGVAGITVASLVIGMTLFAHNVGGARDVINQWGMDLGKQVPAMKGFLDMLGQLGVEIVETFNPKTRFTMDFINQGLEEIRTRSVPTLGALKTAIEDLIQPMEGAGTEMIRMSGNVQATAVALLDLKTQTDMFTKTFGPMYDQGKDVTVLFYEFSDSVLNMIDVLKGVPSLRPMLEQTLRAWNDKIQDGKVTVQEFADFLKTEMVTLLSDSARVIDKELETMTLSVEDRFQNLVNNIDTQIAPALATAMAELKRLLSQGIGGEGDPYGKIMAFTGVEQNIQKVITAMGPLIKQTDLQMEATKELAEIALPMYIKQMGLSGGVTEENTQAVVKNATELLKSAKIPDVLRVPLEALINTFGNAEDKSVAFAASLSEEEKEYINLAKAVYDLNIANQEELEAAKPLLESAKARIDIARDEFEAARDNAIQYGVSAEALNEFTVETDYSTESIQQKTLALIELTNSQIEWNEITDGSTESLIRLAEATQEGIVQFKDLYEQFVLGSEQAEAFGKILSENVLAVLEEFPDAITTLGDQLETIFPNIARDLAAFEGKITPFDKDSVKEYKKELKELDIPKDLRKQFVDSFKIGQDKQEIQAELDGLFEGIAGTMAHQFESIDTEDIFGWLDEMEIRLEEMGEEGINPAFIENIQGIIEEIRNSEDPFKTFIQHADELSGAFDLQAMDKVNLIMNIFGTEVGNIVKDSALGKFIIQSDTLGEAFTKIVQSGVAQYLEDVRANLVSLTEETGLKSRFLTEDQELIPRAKEALAQKKLEEGEPAAAGAAADKGAGALAKAWQDAQTIITNASTVIQQSITGMHNVVNALLLLEIQGVVNTQTAWSTFSTSLMTYGNSMSTNFALSQQLINASLLLMIEGVVNTNTAWSTFSTSVATYSTSMSTNFDAARQAINESLLLQIEGVENTNNTWSVFSESVATYSKSMTTNFDSAQKAINKSLLLQIEGVENTNDAWSIFSESVATYCESMTKNIEAWREAVESNMDDAVDAFGKAEDAVNSLQDAIDALKSKTVTIKVNIEKSGGGNGAQYGGVEILDKSKIFMGGEGSKPEIHFFYPLDQMSQSHAKSEYTLPFNIGDLTGPRINAASIAGAGGAGTPQMVLPSNLVSNINMRANLNIDLGNEIKKVVRQEIKAISEARLDRMPMR